MFYHKKNKAEITEGLQIDDPMIFIAWDTSVNDLDLLLQDYPLSHITEDYYIFKDVELFGTLTCNIGLHFDNILTRIEFFRNDGIDLRKSYNDFQVIFEGKFGKPTRRSSGSTNFESCEWDISNKLKIHHYVMHRFGLSEYLFIEHKP